MKVDHLLKVITVVVVLFTVYTLFIRTTQTLEEEIRSTVRSFYYTWNRCIRSQIFLFKSDAQVLWDKIGNASTYCQNYTGVGQLQVIEYPNADESKYHILPGDYYAHTTIVTLGIGHDVSAEQKLKVDLGQNALFFGADPISELNSKLFEPVGKFYPYAVSGNSGISKASVLKDGRYQPLDVVHVDLVHFLREVVEGNLTVFDNIWIDAEGGEYSMFPFFYKEGQLDQNNITVCQFNMEVHQPNDEQKGLFRDFINQILIDARYAFLKMTTAAGHWRMYFVNMDNDLCSRKYLVRIAQ